MGRPNMMYELLYIVPTRYTDTEIGDIQKKVNGFIEKVGGKVQKEENLGRIRLAYPIKQNRHGSYILNYFEIEKTGEDWLETSVIADIDKEFRMAEEILRHMIVQLPKGIPERTFKLEAYIAPLSEEEDEMRRATRRTIVTDTPRIQTPATETEPAVRQEPPMSMEDLDKRLDEILEANPSDRA
jgi:ribosomal protein S6